MVRNVLWRAPWRERRKTPRLGRCEFVKLSCGHTLHDSRYNVYWSSATCFIDTPAKWVSPHSHVWFGKSGSWSFQVWSVSLSSLCHPLHEQTKKHKTLRLTLDNPKSHTRYPIILCPPLGGRTPAATGAYPYGCHLRGQSPRRLHHPRHSLPSGLVAGAARPLRAISLDVVCRV